MINNTNTFRIQIEFSRKITLVKVTRNENMFQRIALLFQSPTLPRLSLALQGKLTTRWPKYKTWLMAQYRIFT